MPPGRTPIVTKLINAARRGEVMGAVAHAVAQRPPGVLGAR